MATSSWTKTSVAKTTLTVFVPPNAHRYLWDAFLALQSKHLCYENELRVRSTPRCFDIASTVLQMKSLAMCWASFFFLLLFHRGFAFWCTPKYAKVRITHKIQLLKSFFSQNSFPFEFFLFRFLFWWTINKFSCQSFRRFDCCN